MISLSQAFLHLSTSGNKMFWKKKLKCSKKKFKRFPQTEIFQIDSSTIEGFEEFVQSQNSCVNSVFVSEKNINNWDNFRIKCLSYS